jgi:hypothetical protein
MQVNVVKIKSSIERSPQSFRKGRANISSPEELSSTLDLPPSRSALGPTRTTIQWVPRALSPEVKQTSMNLTTHLHLVSKLLSCVKCSIFDNVTDLINTLPGNGYVNRFQRATIEAVLQLYTKQIIYKQN